MAEQANQPNPDDAASQPGVSAPDAAAPATAPSAASTTAPAAGAPGPAAPTPAPVELPAFSQIESKQGPRGIDLLSDVNLNVKIELGRTRMLVEDVLKLCEGAVVELDKLAGDPVDVYVNDRPIARGEVLVLNDNFCVRINEIIDPDNEDDKAHPRVA